MGIIIEKRNGIKPPQWQKAFYEQNHDNFIKKIVLKGDVHYANVLFSITIKLKKRLPLVIERKDLI